MNVAPSIEEAARALLAERREVAEAEELAALVADEQARRDQAAQEARERAEQERVDRAGDRAATEREKAVGALLAVLPELERVVGRVVCADTDAQTAAVAAGRGYKPIRGSVGERIVVALRDAGLTGDVFGFIPAQWAARLRTLYPVPGDPVADTATATTTTTPVTEPRCSVCSSEHRAAIEEALQAGRSYREIERGFGVTRSAIGRHARGHPNGG